MKITIGHPPWILMIYNTIFSPEPIHCKSHKKLPEIYQLKPKKFGEQEAANI